MNDFRKFDQVKTSELFITRHKWFRPYYELTDGQFIYGKLSYKGSLKRVAYIETADGNWSIKHKGWFNRTMFLNKNDDETIGTIVPETWKRNVAIKMDDGFEAYFLSKKLFCNTLVLTHEKLGDILTLKHKPLGIKRPVDVIIEQSTITGAINKPLFILAGAHLILLRRAQAAAVAAS